jgi:hypothetical protein
MWNPSYIAMTVTVIVFSIALALVSQQSKAITEVHSSNSSVGVMPLSIKMPLFKEYVNGNMLYSLATDASDNKTAAVITKTTGFKVNFAPALALILISARGQGYSFVNGVLRMMCCIN